MNKVLEGHGEYADSFFDDVGIFSDNWLFHLEHLKLVFQELRDAKLRQDRVNVPLVSRN